MNSERPQGRMMQLPLLVSSLLDHAETNHGATEVVSRQLDGSLHRQTWAQTAQRARQAAKALTTLGVAAGDRVATLAWNGYRHVELYYAVSGSGAVIHTVNPRLFAEQIAWIINDAGSRIVCFDLSFQALVEQIAPQCSEVRYWIALCDAPQLPASPLPLLAYESLLAAESDDYRWPALDERAPCALCYTSGTTGHPKGVAYSHRSAVLHAMASGMPDAMNLSAREVVLPVVPMFHVNAWGLPYSAAMVGAKLVLPGSALDGASLVALFEGEGVTFAAGVPTVWLGVLQHLQKTGQRLSTVRRMIVGGAACPPSLMQAFADEQGVTLQHAWGMTELSPLGTVNTPTAASVKLDPQARMQRAAKQGRAPFGIELKTVDACGKPLPRDGQTAGDLLVRGHWVVSRYQGGSEDPLVDGWFPTGDVAHLDAEGYLQITDRSKDVIKSGGEWISSIELENIAMSHPAVAEAAAIGIRHPKWDERPLIVVVVRAGHSVDRPALLAHYQGRIAKWCIPDDVLVLEALPHTATGKVSKLLLRDELRDYRWPVPA